MNVRVVALRGTATRTQQLVMGERLSRILLSQSRACKPAKRDSR